MREPTRESRAAPRSPLSVLVLTKDEEVNIRECLEALSFSDDVVVLDSYSTDRTVQIAQGFPNVRVVQRVFDTEYRQRDYGLKEIKYKHPWLYICDADERVPEDLVEEMTREVTRPDQPAKAFRLRYKNMYRGRWIKHATTYPVWLIRLVRPECVAYEERQTNVHPIVDGPIGELRGHFVHYSFNSGLTRWFHKHNFYSDREALEAVMVRRAKRPPLKLLFNADPIVRRRAAKNLSFLLGGRAIWRFLYGYLLRGGWMDGMAGFHYCAMVSMYEYWTELKIYEQEEPWQERNRVLAERLLSEARTDLEPLIDVIIPTLNEAHHIEQAVLNASQLGRVYVLDSCSRDGTQDLARRAGAVLIEHPFEGYARQKNWGLDHLPLSRPWVFILDADERITPELREELRRAATDPASADGYFINRLLLFMGRPVRHGGLFPSWNLRFFRRGRCRYEDRSVHEHMLCDGRTGYFKSAMLHLRRENVTAYIAKHIRYADLESDEWFKRKLGMSTGAKPSKLFRDVLRVRQWLRREVWPTLPGRPLWRFVWMYFVRFGFLDGRVGWHLALLMASYEYMISLLYHDKLARHKEGKFDLAEGNGGAAPVVPKMN